MNLAIRLTLDGLVQALRTKQHRVKDRQRLKAAIRKRRSSKAEVRQKPVGRAR